jgi:hypothetical protein
VLRPVLSDPSGKECRAGAALTASRLRAFAPSPQDVVA